MWRAFFLAIGITMCIIGGEFLLIEKAILANSAVAATVDDLSAPSVASGGGSREFKPPEWAPWSLLSVGAVVILYSFTIPRRVAS